MQQLINFEFKCNQKSRAFRQVDGNPFCQVCQTTVFNLADKSKDEIKKLITQNGGQICGQFFIDQIAVAQPEKRQVSFKIMLASVAAFFTITATKISAQTNDTIKTEQHDSISSSVKKEDTQIARTDTSCTILAEGGNYPLTTPDEKKKKEFMVIGRWHFYTTNKFPFIKSKSTFRGRLKW